jgi:hypothetical protein
MMTFSRKPAYQQDRTTPAAATPRKAPRTLNDPRALAAIAGFAFGALAACAFALLG